MSYRVIILENELAVSVRLDNLIVKRYGEDIWIPLSDISAIVFDNMKISLTARMLAVLAENNISTIFCNSEHQPIGLYTAYDSHSRSSKILKFQIEKNEKTDIIWREIVEKKIQNQAGVLDILSLDKNRESQRKLINYINELEFKEVDVVEAHSAKEYFKRLGGEGFSRRNDSILLNAGLNYGYSIIRSYVAKLCVGTGLNTQIGLHHRSEYNRFNLVDDLMEPMRPFVDLSVYRLLNNEKYFLPEHRHKIVNLLNHKCKYNGKTMYISNVLEKYVEQFSKWYREDGVKLVYPSVLDYLGEEDEL